MVIGVGSGWQNYNADGTLTEDDFTDASGGITVGDNGTEQVIVLSGLATDHGTPVTTLAHELTHALRGDYNIRDANPGGGTDWEEEAYADQVENQVREELGIPSRPPPTNMPRRPRPMRPSTRPTPTSTGSTTCRKETSP